jgi:hypothetical protein
MLSYPRFLLSLVTLVLFVTPIHAQPATGETGNSSLKITVTPPDAKVKVDGKVVPLDEGVAFIEQIASGTHNVAVSHPDYIEKAADIALIPNRAAVLQVQLEGKPSRVEIRSSPKGALVLLDDKTASYYGATTDNTPVALMLKAGKYVLNLKADDYKTYQEKLVILPNHPKKLAIHMEQIQPLAKILNWVGAGIAITGAVVGATGSIQDNKRMRNTGWGIAVGGPAIAGASVAIN